MMRIAKKIKTTSKEDEKINEDETGKKQVISSKEGKCNKNDTHGKFGEGYNGRCKNDLCCSKYGNCGSIEFYY
eukprot:jgi/Orpsp1_1/1183433/evm.model.c7180000085177.1